MLLNAECKFLTKRHSKSYSNFVTGYSLYDLLKKLIIRGKKSTTLSDKFNMYFLFLFHTKININCKKCITVVILIS